MNKYRLFLTLLLGLCVLQLGCTDRHKSVSPPFTIRSISQAAWSPDSVYFAFFDNARRFTVRDVNRGREWSKDVEDIETKSHHYAEGRPSHIILWSPKHERVAIAYLSESKPVIHTEVFNAFDGQRLFITDIPISLVDSKYEERSDFILGEWGSNLTQIIVSYSGGSRIDQTVHLIDLKKKHVVKKYDYIIDYKVLKGYLIVLSKYRRKPSRVYVIDEKGKRTQVSLDANQGMINNIASAGQYFYTIQLRGIKGKIHLRLASFRLVKGESFLKWSATAVIGPGKDANSVGLIELLPSEKGDNVAVSIAYASDLSSNRKVWCISRKKIIPPKQTSENVDVIAEVDPLLWRGNNLILREYRQIDFDNNEMRYVNLSLSDKRLSLLKTEKDDDVQSWPSNNLHTVAELEPSPDRDGKFRLVFKKFLSL